MKSPRSKYFGCQGSLSVFPPWVNEYGKCKKYIELWDLIWREAMTNGELKLKYCPSTKMVSNILKKKPLGPEKFSRYKKLMLMNIPL